MSGDAVGYVFTHSPADRAPAVMLVHLALADVANDLNHNKLWMSQAALAAKTRLSRQTVNAALSTLVAEGFLDVLTAGRGKPVQYRFVTNRGRPAAWGEGVKESDTPCGKRAGHRVGVSKDATPNLSTDATPGVGLVDTHLSTDATPPVKSFDTELNRTQEGTQEDLKLPPRSALSTGSAVAVLDTATVGAPAAGGESDVTRVVAEAIDLLTAYRVDTARMAGLVVTNPAGFRRHKRHEVTGECGADLERVARASGASTLAELLEAFDLDRRWRDARDGAVRMATGLALGDLTTEDDTRDEVLANYSDLFAGDALEALGDVAVAEHRRVRGEPARRAGGAA